MLSDGTWTYTWKHGRQLASMTTGSNTWSFTYNADGLRTKRANSNITYTYGYTGDKLTYMKRGGIAMYFGYDASGKPASVVYNGTQYYYITNLQGDVIAITDRTGAVVAEYTYDAWGNVLTTTGSMASTLGTYNPLRYRGYVYDTETELYYLQSRYYDPELGRFISADGQISGVGTDLLGNNQFAYCFNNPVNLSDSSGNWPKLSSVLRAIGTVALAVAAVAVCVAAAPAIIGASAAASVTAVCVAVAATCVSACAYTSAVVMDVVETTKTKTTEEYRDNSVYVMRDSVSKDVQYIGRTNDPVRRQNEHARDHKKAHLDPLEVKVTGLTKSEARVVEQILISAYTLMNLDNARREIAVGNIYGFRSSMNNVISIFEGIPENELLNLMGR